jgi:hypothetical protein
MEITKRAGRHTVNMVILMMKKIQSIKSVNVLVSKHVIARSVTKGGVKSAENVGKRKKQNDHKS